MTDIKIKRKELETAKDMLQRGTCGGVDCDNCPFGCPFHDPWDSLKSEAKAKIESFIATREAELAVLDKDANIADGFVKTGKLATAVGTVESYDLKAAETVCPTCQGKGTVSVRDDQEQGNYHQAYTGPGVLTHGGKSYPVAPVGTDMGIIDRPPTLDDFALALIQGGFCGTRFTAEAVYNAAEALKAESDLRRKA